MCISTEGNYFFQIFGVLNFWCLPQADVTSFIFLCLNWLGSWICAIFYQQSSSGIILYTCVIFFRLFSIQILNRWKIRLCLVTNSLSFICILKLPCPLELLKWHVKLSPKYSSVTLTGISEALCVNRPCNRHYFG